MPGPPGSSLYGEGGTSSAGSGGGASALLLDSSNLVVVAGAGGGGVFNTFSQDGDANITIIGDSDRGNAGSPGQTFAVVSIPISTIVFAVTFGGGAGTDIGPGVGGLQAGAEVGQNGNPSPGSSGGDGVTIWPGSTSGASGGGGGGYFGGGSGAAGFGEEVEYSMAGEGGGGSSFLAGFVSYVTEGLLASPSGGYVSVTYF